MPFCAILHSTAVLCFAMTCYAMLMLYRVVALPCVQESEAGELVVSNTCRVTASQAEEFLRRCLDKYKRALVEPGEASLSQFFFSLI